MSEEFLPNLIVLDLEVPLTRLRIPELDGVDGPGQVPAVFEQKLIVGAAWVHRKMPTRRIFVVHPATWSTMPQFVRDTLEPFEVKEERGHGPAIRFRTTDESGLDLP